MMVAPNFFPTIVALMLFVIFTTNPLTEISARQTVSVAGSIDFNSQILPILKARCFACHSAAKSEGDLRLDLEASVHQGGHTGNRIIAERPEKSELFRRITSTEMGYRMPKMGDPLSVAEIDLFRQWIEQGANWPATRSLPARPVSTIDYWGEQLNRFDAIMSLRRYFYLQYLVVPIIVWIVLVFASILARARVRKLASRKSLTWIANFGLIRQSICLIAIVGVGAWLFQFGLVEELEYTNQDLANQLALAKRLPFQVSLDPGNLTLPPYPMHPRRLGGVYYRGNDERSPALFNGGFYRTATMELWLVDDQNRRYRWGDEIPASPLFISLNIHRGPGTTPMLFSQSVFQSTYLRRFRQSDLVIDSRPFESDRINLSELTPEQQWEAKIPLEPALQWKDAATEGMVYLFYGAQMVDGHQGRVHFGIKYNLKLVDNKISNVSELWMGSTYDLGGTVLIPRASEIQLDQWFDFRPIPEIVGENTGDPNLLGIPEHVQ